MQPVGDLCDLLGVSRFRPGVFEAMVDILYTDGNGGGDGARDARLADLGRRLTRGA
jgi:hypothetical protein